jgi:hypothetical protein
MEPITFKGHTVVFARNQPEYKPLPAHVEYPGIVTCCWRLSWTERIAVLLTGHLWQRVYTFYKPLQPQKFLLDRPKELGR